MCIVLLPPGVNPTAVNKYIIPCHFKEFTAICFLVLETRLQAACKGLYIIHCHKMNVHFMASCYTVCLTRYRIRNFFNNSNTNEDIAKKFEQEYFRCVRNEKECVCSPLQISLQCPH